MPSKKTKSKRPVVRRTSPTTCSVSLSPDVMKFAASCIEAWAALARTPPIRAEHQGYEFSLYLADYVVSEMRKAYRAPNPSRQTSAARKDG